MYNPFSMDNFFNIMSCLLTSVTICIDVYNWVCKKKTFLS